MNSIYILKLGALLLSIGMFTTFIFITMNVQQKQINEKAHDIATEIIEDRKTEIIEEPNPIHEETCNGIINAYEKQSMRKEAPTFLKKHYDNCLTYGSPNPPKEVKEVKKVEKKPKIKTNNSNKKAKPQ